jgi:hypothetical protein
MTENASSVKQLKLSIRKITIKIQRRILIVIRHEKLPTPGPLDLGSGMGKKFESGSRIRNIFDPKSGIRDAKFRIRDKHSGSATLTDTHVLLFFDANTYSQRFADHFYLLSGRRSSGQQGQSLMRRRRRWWHSPPSPARSTPPFPSGNVS